MHPPGGPRGQPFLQRGEHGLVETGQALGPIAPVNEDVAKRLQSERLHIGIADPASEIECRAGQLVGARHLPRSDGYLGLAHQQEAVLGAVDFVVECTAGTPQPGGTHRRVAFHGPIVVELARASAGSDRRSPVRSYHR